MQIPFDITWMKAGGTQIKCMYILFHITLYFESLSSSSSLSFSSVSDSDKPHSLMLMLKGSKELSSRSLLKPSFCRVSACQTQSAHTETDILSIASWTSFSVSAVCHVSFDLCPYNFNRIILAMVWWQTNHSVTVFSGNVVNFIICHWQLAHFYWLQQLMTCLCGSMWNVSTGEPCHGVSFSAVCSWWLVTLFWVTAHTLHYNDRFWSDIYQWISFEPLLKCHCSHFTVIINGNGILFSPKN